MEITSFLDLLVLKADINVILTIVIFIDFLIIDDVVSNVTLLTLYL